MGTVVIVLAVVAVAALPEHAAEVVAVAALPEHAADVVAEEALPAKFVHVNVFVEGK